MDPSHVPGDLPDELAANREELRRRSRAERVASVWLWLGVLTGPIAFAASRIAATVLVSHGCSRGSAMLGLSPAQAATAGITAVAALITIAAGLIAWRVWRRTSLPEDEVTSGEMPRVPFFALGGVLVSGFSLLAIVYSGAMAIVLSTACP